MSKFKIFQMEEVIESFRDGFAPHEFEYQQDHSASPINNVLILVSLITIIAAGYLYIKIREENEKFIDPERV